MMKNTTFILLFTLLSVQSVWGQRSVAVSAQNGFIRRYRVEQNTYSFGLAGRYRYGNRGVEIKLDYMQESYSKYQVEANTLHLSASYMYFPTFFVYFLIGAGVNFEEYTQAWERIPREYKNETIGLILTGMGTRIPLADNLSLSLDVRYIMQDNDFEYLPLHKDFNYYYQLNLLISYTLFH